jgi:hypothetical protein
MVGVAGLYPASSRLRTRASPTGLGNGGGALNGYDEGPTNARIGSS